MMCTRLSSLFSSETTLKSNHKFLIKLYQHLLTAFLRQESQFNYIPAKCSAHFEFTTLRSPTVVRLLSAAVSQVKKLRKKIFYPQATPEALLFLTATNFEREESRFCTLRCLFVQQANSSSVQLAVRSSTWYWQHHSVNTYCWLWVPTPCPLNWMTPNARKVRSLSDPLSRMQLPRLVYLWWLPGELLRWRHRKESTSKLF